MAFTGQLGTDDSMWGDIELGAVAAASGAGGAGATNSFLWFFPVLWLLLWF